MDTLRFGLHIIPRDIVLLVNYDADFGNAIYVSLSITSYDYVYCGSRYYVHHSKVTKSIKRRALLPQLSAQST